MTFFLPGNSLDEKVIKDNDMNDVSIVFVMETALCDRLIGNTGFVTFQDVKTH
jgi:hypothetical protein